MLARVCSRQLVPLAGVGLAGMAAVAAGSGGGSLGERVRHAAEEVVLKVVEAEHAVEHAVGGAVNKVTDAVHLQQARAREEAERGMFTADDISEVAEQVAARREHRKPRIYHADEDEQLLEDASSDLGTRQRQAELAGLRSAVQGEGEGEGGARPATAGARSAAAPRPTDAGFDSEGDDEALLEDVSQDWGRSQRQKEMEELRKVAKDD